MKEIIFVTTNKGKIASAQHYFKKHNLVTYNYELTEPRTDDIKEIARSKVEQAYEKVGKPCIALDVGFFIEELNGFPRAYVNFALETLGLEGILKLLEDKTNRNCKFVECLAYYDGKEIKYFYGEHIGTLATSIKGEDYEHKWSILWHIFMPSGYNKTLAEFSKEELENHRNRSTTVSSMKQFSRWYENQ